MGGGGQPEPWSFRPPGSLLATPPHALSARSARGANLLPPRILLHSTLVPGAASNGAASLRLVCHLRPLLYVVQLMTMSCFICHGHKSCRNQIVLLHCYSSKEPPRLSCRILTGSSFWGRGVRPAFLIHVAESATPDCFGRARRRQRGRASSQRAAAGGRKHFHSSPSFTVVPHRRSGLRRCAPHVGMVDPLESWIGQILAARTRKSNLEGGQRSGLQHPG